MLFYLEIIFLRFPNFNVVIFGHALKLLYVLLQLVLARSHFLVEIEQGALDFHFRCLQIKKSKIKKQS